ncbi:hypothetical protein A2739_02855 [Candidatus Giovannonibacteria bacterium RIFCSPHIGHO2_01_FULL_43_100]|uniref:Uncharacterized protein n=1 Tax=Candidatus Giovannonibacteria bacterium RIFCSPHIGHO2_12_FULL_43_15 TaxID=1798341 RepID=A0A1F5WP55_9BACT|nr:MAG: hypothetical protein A2739_02855 [Candidatus Giovannonibacteria bacterium RIFCSPHIGHO2_01_FULL_43_100]OGF77453.1 MAG: hypothetical protein A3F23_00545 [Candidatus Giovannonibacteria bacterium RIFCSPHIGHO2_12_FULL_43_15]
MIIKNSKLLLPASIVFLIALVLCLIFLYKIMERFSGESSETRGQIAIFNSQIKDLRVFENYIADTENEKLLLEKAFINRDELVMFIEDLERVGRDVGVDVRVESANLAASPKDIGPSLHLEARGNFSSVFKYSMLLENLPYEIAFEKIDIDKTGDVDAPWRGDYIIKLLSYEF